MEHLDYQQARQTSSPQQVNIQRDLRYVLTQACNYQCSFCHKEGCDGGEKELLDADDYAFIFSTAKETLGINQVTLSGGEPMIRGDIAEITEKLNFAGAKVTMVSNGSLLFRRPEAMEHVDVLNVSLHATQQDLFTAITGSNTNVKDLLSSLSRLNKMYPHLQIKLNSALINKQNTPDTSDFALKLDLAETYGWKLKYLELSDSKIPGFVKLEDFEDKLVQLGFILDHQSDRQSFYKKGNVEIITGKVFCSQAKNTENPELFCKQHNDIYVTPDGYFSCCPLDIKRIDAYDAIIHQRKEPLKQALKHSVNTTAVYSCPFTS